MLAENKLRTLGLNCVTIDFRILMYCTIMLSECRVRFYEVILCASAFRKAVLFEYGRQLLVLRGSRRGPLIPRSKLLFVTGPGRDFALSLYGLMPQGGGFSDSPSIE